MKYFNVLWHDIDTHGMERSLSDIVCLSLYNVRKIGLCDISIIIAS